MTSKGVINMGISREDEGMIGKCCPTGIKKKSRPKSAEKLC